jgi:hypothetical protein
VIISSSQSSILDKWAPRYKDTKNGVSLYAFLTMALEVSGQLRVPATLLCVRTTQARTRKQSERCGKPEVSCHCRETILSSTVITSVVVTIPTQLSHFRKARFKKAGWIKVKKKVLICLQIKMTVPEGVKKCRMRDRYSGYSTLRKQKADSPKTSVYVYET